eukprot:s465_g25.t1
MLLSPSGVAAVAQCSSNKISKACSAAQSFVLAQPPHHLALWALEDMFWGCIVAPGETKKVETKAGELLHLSQACLAPDTPSGASSKVLVEQTGQTYAVACLKEGGQEFCALDLFLDAKEAKIAVKGKATVHLTGYFEADELDEDDLPPAAPQGSPKAKAEPKSSPKAAPKSSPKAAPKASPKEAAKAKAASMEDDDDDLLEGEEGEEEEPKESDKVVKPAAKASPKAEPKKASPKAEPKATPEDDEDDDMEEEEEEGAEDDPVVKPQGKAEAKGKAKAAPMGDDDDDDEEEEEEEGDDDDDEVDEPPAKKFKGDGGLTKQCGAHLPLQLCPTCVAKERAKERTRERAKERIRERAKGKEKTKERRAKERVRARERDRWTHFEGRLPTMAPPSSVFGPENAEMAILPPKIRIFGKIEPNYATLA